MQHDAGKDPGEIERVNIRIITTPSNATITIDGKRVETSPYSASHEASGEEHTVVVEAEGFRTIKRLLRYSESQRLELALEPEKIEAKRMKRKIKRVTNKGTSKVTTTPAKNGIIDVSRQKRRIIRTPPW